MDREEMINAEDYDTLLKEVETNSPYKRLPSPTKKWMSVSEMGELLGLKKTGRYWLVHKNYFETKEFAGKMRVNIESFEKWYANQIKYHKVNGEEPGKELKEWSYSIPELAEMLELTDGIVYDLIKRDNTVDCSGSQTIAYQVWGEEYIDITPKAIHNLLSRLRQKLQVTPDSPEYIVSVRSIGYKFDAGI